MFGNLYGSTESNAEACQLRCQRTLKCAYFSYLKPDMFFAGTCHLSDIFASKIHDTTAVSGPKHCTALPVPGTLLQYSEQSMLVCFILEYHAFSRYYLFSKSSLDIFLVDRTWQCAPGIGGIRGNPGPGVEGVFRLTFEQCKARFSGSGHNFVYHQRSLHCQKMNHYIPGITDGNTDWRSCTQDQSQSTYASSNIVV